MLKRSLMMLLVVLNLVVFTRFAHAQLPQIAPGLSYLSSSQNADGTWGSAATVQETTATTVAGIETLKLLNQTAGSAYTNATGWLQGQTPTGVDYIAQRIRALGITDASIAAVLPFADPASGGWGGDDGHVTNALDTSSVLQALRSANYPDLSVSNTALAYLTNTQNSDGGWGFSAGDDSSIFVTAMVSAALRQYPQTTKIATALARSSAWLISKQNVDGGFGVTASGTAASSAYETALAYIALAGDGQTQGLPLQRAISYLTSTQSLNGSWNDDPYSTALALKALYLSENKPASPLPAPTTGGIMATVADGLSNTPLTGVTATLVSNPALTATTNAAGTFVLSGIANGWQQITLSAAGYAPLTITTTLNAGDFINAGRVSLFATPASGTVQGIVWSVDLNAPFPGVTVRVVSGGVTYETISGPDGSYKIANIPAGTVTLGTPEGPKNGLIYWNVLKIDTLSPGGILIYNPRMSTTLPANATLYLRTDKTLYKAAENVALTVNIQNNRSTAYAATLKLHVTDPSGASVYDTSVAANLTANTMLTQNAGFVMPTSAKGGSYTAQAELYDASNVLIGTASSVFTLQVIPIAVTPKLPAQFVQGTNSIAFDVINNRNIAVSAGALAIALKDPDGQTIATSSQPFSLAQGETKTISYELTFPDLKFGTYTLSYTQSDEATDGLTGTISLPNSIDVPASFDKFSYKTGETANLQISLNNTGKFNLDSVAVNVAVPDAGYEDTKNLTITSGNTLTQQNSIPVPGSISSGEHAATITLTLPGGASTSKNIPCLVAQSILSVTPADASKDVPVRTSILVRFSENVAPSSITAGMVTLTANNVQAPGSMNLTADGSSLIFTPQSKLAYATTYTFTIKASALTPTGKSTVIDLASTFSTPVVDPDLVGYWPMDGDWKDYSGKGNNAEAYGSITFENGRVPLVKSARIVNDSASFPGSGGYIPTAAEYIASAPNTFTMSLWAKPTATRNTTPEAVTGISGKGGQRYAIAPSIPDIYGAGAGVSVGTNGVSIFEHNGSENYYGGYTTSYLSSVLVYDAPTPLSDWTHVVVVYNNKQPSLYLNGVLVKTGQTSQESFVYASALFADYVTSDYSGTPTSYGAYSGQLEEVAVYKRALTTQEIQTLYQNSSRQTPVISITSPGQTVKYKPGETGSATVTATYSIGINKLYCSISGAAIGAGLVFNFDTPQLQTTQQLSFQVAPNPEPTAALKIVCVAQTLEWAFGAGEIELQVADTIPPTVVSSTPADNATNVSASIPVSVTFSEIMDPKTFIYRDTFKFQRASDCSYVTGRYSLSEDGKQLIVELIPALDAATQYVITIGAVKDMAGNVMTNPYVVRFTTLEQTTLTSLTITDQGSPTTPYVLAPGSYGTLTLNNSNVVYSGGVTANSLSLTNSTMSITGTSNVTGNVFMDNSTLTLKKAMQVTGNITLQNQSILTHFVSTTTDTSKLDITSGSMNIEEGSKIDVSGKGYLGGIQGGNTGTTGRTLGNTTTGGSDGRSGASYGGYGGIGSSPSNAVYGDISNPNELGSGGSGYVDVDIEYTTNLPGGNGGGLVRITTGSLQLNGSIVADGNVGNYSGAGSGGGVRIDAGIISGTGSISAKGGSSKAYFIVYGTGRPAGGGRIAVYYNDMSLPTGNISASGGQSYSNSPSQNGGAGTIYLKDNSKANPDLIINNGGLSTNKVTPVSGADYGNVDVSGGAAISISFNGPFAPDHDVVINNTQMTVNGALTTPGSLTLTNSSLTITGNASIPGNITLNNCTVVISGTLTTIPASITLVNSSMTVSGNVIVANGVNLTGSTLNISGGLTLTDDLLLDHSSIVLGSKLNLQNNLVMTNSSTLTVLGDLVVSTNLILTNSTLNVSGTVTTPGTITMTGSTLAAKTSVTASGAISLAEASVLTHPVSTTIETVTLVVSAPSISIDGTSKIDVTGRGYLGGYQGGNNNMSCRTTGNTVAPGTAGGNGSMDYSGGSYGGIGGIYDSRYITNAAYGAPANPTEPGAGGGADGVGSPGGNGGGYVRIMTPSLALNGSIIADGQTYPVSGSGGGGAGGGIRIDATTITGAGFVYARGGASWSGRSGSGGGGGRIAVYYGTSTIPVANILANGGTGRAGITGTNGGAGTVYLKDAAQTNPVLKVDNGGIITSNTTPVPGGNYDQLNVSGGAVIAMTGDVNPGSDLTITGSTLNLTGGMTAPGNLTLDGSSITVSGPVNITGALTLKNGSILSHYGATMTSTWNLQVNAASVSIDSTSKFDVTGKGYLGANWTVGNSTTYGRTLGNVNGSTGYSGGSYGGLGASWTGNVANVVYGNMADPNELGSGGGGANNGYIENTGGNGGGLIRLSTASLVLNGTIAADGGSNSNAAGGGSGGGIRIDTGSLSGTGTIHANGGTITGANTGGSGGGGRIAVYYTASTLPTANITATGGAGTRPGGAGTIFLTPNTMPLTITETGTGAGTVASTPVGISCGATCSYQLATMSTVTLTATPAPDTTFNGWSGACSGVGTCVVTMDAAKGVTATFSLIPPPTVTITSPSGFSKNNRPTLQYFVSSGTVVVKVDGVVVSKVSGNALDFLAEGVHTIRVEATNSGGTGFAETTVTVDTIPPALAVNTIQSSTATSTLTLTGTIETGASLNVSANTSATIGPVSFSADAWSCPVSNLAPGLNTFTVTALDQATNSSTTSVSVTYNPPLAISLSETSMVADHQGSVGITINNISPAASELLIEQLVDINGNGIIDSNDYVIRSFKVTDGTLSANPNVQGDEDTTANSTVQTTLNQFLANDIYHAPGSYIFKATKESETATAAFTVTPVSQLQTVSGMVTDSTNPVPGALVQLTDRWQRHVAWAIADDSGAYVLNVKQPGDYNLTPLAYGYVATATPVTLAASQSIVNQPLALTTGTCHVTGQVKDAASGAGIAGVWVQATGTNTNAVVITNDSGAYDLLLPADTYTITAFAGSYAPGVSPKGYTGFDNLPLNATVSATTALPDITLTAGSIQASGRILDATGNPVTGIPVKATIRGTIDNRQPTSTGISDATGNYSLGLFSGANWDISLDNAVAQTLGYLGTNYHDLSTTTGPLTGNDLTIHPITAWIQGTVKDSTSKLLPGVEVKLRNADSSIIASVFTASDGTYRLGAFAGNWYIGVLTENKGTQPVSEQSFAVVNGQAVAIDFAVDVTTPISITTTVLPDGYFSEKYNASLVATGGTPPYTWSLISGVLPPHLVLDPSNGTISGLMVNVGTYPLTLQVADSAGAETTKNINMNSYMFVAITTTSLPQGTLGAEYSKTINAVGGKPPYTWSVSSGNLPAGLILNAANGVISGIPAASGSSIFTVQVIDSNGNMTSANYTNGVEAFKALSINVIDPLSITSNSLPSGNVSSVYGQTLAAGGGKAPYTWSIASGTLPAGLSLIADSGVISGIPTAAGDKTFTVQVADANGATATKVISIKISEPVVSQLNYWTNLYSGAPKNTTATNLAVGSFTVGSGTNRLLLVAVVMETGTAANPTISASYGGTALTQIKITANTQREIVWVGYLKESQIGIGSKALTITYSGATGKVSAMHVNWAAYSGVNQTTPVASYGGLNTATTSASFGSTINYVTNGMTTVIAGNGGTPAIATLGATPAFTADTATTTDAQTSRTFTTAKHTANGSYASSTAVTWSGTTSKWSGLVVVSLQP